MSLKQFNRPDTLTVNLVVNVLWDDAYSISGSLMVHTCINRKPEWVTHILLAANELDVCLVHNISSHNKPLFPGSPGLYWLIFLFEISFFKMIKVEQRFAFVNNQSSFNCVHLHLEVSYAPWALYLNPNCYGTTSDIVEVMGQGRFFAFILRK